MSRLLGLLCEAIPFRFLRFSDGELEILRNARLEITRTHIRIGDQVSPHSLPPYDIKDFVPERDSKIRADLVLSAEHRACRYFKGVPASHNSAEADRDLMVKLNGGLDAYLTFADLLINSNYRVFLRDFVPALRERCDVYVLGNFRMNPQLVEPTWRLLPVPDNFFRDYDAVKANLKSDILSLAPDAVLLSSASTLSNIAGYIVDIERPDLTFIDIGTSLHGMMGLDSSTRDYHTEAEPWTVGTAFRKMRYRRSRHFRMKW